MVRYGVVFLHFIFISACSAPGDDVVISGAVSQIPSEEEASDTLMEEENNGPYLIATTGGDQHFLVSYRFNEDTNQFEEQDRISSLAGINDIEYLEDLNQVAVASDSSTINFYEVNRATGKFSLKASASTKTRDFLRSLAVEKLNDDEYYIVTGGDRWTRNEVDSGASGPCINFGYLYCYNKAPGRVSFLSYKPSEGRISFLSETDGPEDIYELVYDISIGFAFVGGLGDRVHSVDSSGDYILDANGNHTYERDSNGNLALGGMGIYSHFVNRSSRSVSDGSPYFGSSHGFLGLHKSKKNSSRIYGADYREYKAVVMQASSGGSLTKLSENTVASSYGRPRRIVASLDERTLYMTTRGGTDSSGDREGFIFSFSLSEDGTSLAESGKIEVTGTDSRNLSLSPDGKYLVVSEYQTETAGIYEVNSGGALGQKIQSLKLASGIRIQTHVWTE